MERSRLKRHSTAQCATSLGDMHHERALIVFTGAGRGSSEGGDLATVLRAGQRLCTAHHDGPGTVSQLIHCCAFHLLELRGPGPLIERLGPTPPLGPSSSPGLVRFYWSEREGGGVAGRMI